MARIEVNEQKILDLNDNIARRRDRDMPYLIYPTEMLARFLNLKNVLTRAPTPDESVPGLMSAYKSMGNIVGWPMLNLKYNFFGTTYFTMQTSKWPHHCRIMERDYYRCLARVGLQNEGKYCRIYKEDVHECSKQTKSRKRLMYMKRMRKEKGLDKETVDEPPISLSHHEF